MSQIERSTIEYFKEVYPLMFFFKQGDHLTKKYFDYEECFKRFSFDADKTADQVMNLYYDKFEMTSYYYHEEFPDQAFFLAVTNDRDVIFWKKKTIPNTRSKACESQEWFLDEIPEEWEQQPENIYKMSCEAFLETYNNPSAILRKDRIQGSQYICKLDNSHSQFKLEQKQKVLT